MQPGEVKAKQINEGFFITSCNPKENHHGLLSFQSKNPGSNETVSAVEGTQQADSSSTQWEKLTCSAGIQTSAALPAAPSEPRCCQAAALLAASHLEDMIESESEAPLPALPLPACSRH